MCRIIPPTILWAMIRSLLPLDTFFWLPSAQVLPFIFPYLFYFIRLTVSSAFLLSSKYNVYGSMVVATGFPSMGPLSISIYYFTIATTKSPQNLFIPAFADICMNMTLFATIINESVSSFYYFSIIKFIS